MTPPPRLIRLLTDFLISTADKGTLYVPRADIWTSPHTYLEPDLFYVSADTEARLNPERRTTADLVVEVISAGSAIYDRNTKADTYGALGIVELWLVDEVAETLEVRNQKEGRLVSAGVFQNDETVTSQVFPQLQIAVRKVFEKE